MNPEVARSNDWANTQTVLGQDSDHDSNSQDQEQYSKIVKTVSKLEFIVLVSLYRFNFDDLATLTAKFSSCKKQEQLWQS